MVRSWKFWLIVYAATLAASMGGSIVGVRAGLEALQSVTRVRSSGFGGEEDALDRVSHCCRFAVLHWEIENLTRWAVPELFFRREPGEAALKTIDEFFQLGRAIRRAEAEALRAPDPGPTPAVARLKLQQEALQVRTERAMAALVSNVLEQEGLAQRLPNGGPVFPPVAFTLIRPPSVLVVSPRNTIRLERTTLLEPGLSDEEGARLERGTEGLGWSALVEPTGGYSTYPTIVSDRSARDFAFQAVAHEWMHTYLFFRPLGFNYFEAPEMRVVNETVADIVGRVIADRILSMYFGMAPGATGGGQRGVAPATNDPEPRFDFRREMRETRLEVERLLSSGTVDAAEAYMEARRRVFVENGYTIRRLNQAYFAFHGTYADSPASINPIGPQLESLFEKVGSLRSFVSAVERVGSVADFQRLLDAYGVPR